MFAVTPSLPVAARDWRDCTRPMYGGTAPGKRSSRVTCEPMRRNCCACVCVCAVRHVEYYFHTPGRINGYGIDRINLHRRRDVVCHKLRQSNGSHATVNVTRKHIHIIACVAVDAARSAPPHTGNSNNNNTHTKNTTMLPVFRSAGTRARTRVPALSAFYARAERACVRLFVSLLQLTHTQRAHIHTRRLYTNMYTHIPLCVCARAPGVCVCVFTHHGGLRQRQRVS